MLKRHVLIYLFAHAVPAVIGFAGLIAYTHLVSPAQYGVYVVGQSTAAVISMALFGWIRLSVSRYQAEDATVDVRGAVLIGYGVTVAIVITGTLAAFHIGASWIDQGQVLTILFTAVCLSAFELSQEFRRATFEPKMFTVVSIIRSVIGLALGMAAVVTGWGGNGLLLALGSSFLLGTVLFATRSWFQPIRPGQLVLMRRFVQYGTPLALCGIIFAVYAAVDRLAVAYLIGQEAAGQYGVASDLSRQMIGILAASVGAAVSPIAFRTMTTRGAGATSEHMVDSFELLLVIIGPVTVWLAICGPSFANVVMGRQFATSVSLLLPMLACARFFGAISSYYVHVSFQLAERPFLQLVNAVFMLCLYLVLMVLLVGLWGLPGAAAAALVSELCGLLFGLWLTQKSFRFDLAVHKSWQIAAALGLMALASYGAMHVSHSPLENLAYAAIVGGLVYLSALISFDVAEVRGLISVWVVPILTLGSSRLKRWALTFVR
jgi:O-antigen/teichoic acid export membrane protein